MTTTTSGKSGWRYFGAAFAVTVAGLILALWAGWSFSGTVSGTMGVFFICAVLAVLEISLSFDNAIVNANKLKRMTPQWQRRFLTWGIVIAVFGMRVVFPLAVVSIAAHISPLEAVRLAAARPGEYAEIMLDAHVSIAAFGGTFLMMVALGFFFDPNKDIHWLRRLEARLSRVGAVRGVEVGFVLVLMLGFAQIVPDAEQVTFVFSAVYGLVTFLVIDLAGQFLDSSSKSGNMARGGLGAFLYLEVLDASFSFDGVIGAFALTQNLFVIAIGLGIGAMYVRSMTLLLVEKGTLAEYRFLEHGAFYAILALSVIMYVQTMMHVSEVLTGFIGVVLIGLALLSSVRQNRRETNGTAADRDA